MIYLVVMAVLLFVPTAAFFGAYQLADRLQSSYKLSRKDRDLVDRGIAIARKLRDGK